MDSIETLIEKQKKEKEKEKELLLIIPGTVLGILALFLSAVFLETSKVDDFLCEILLSTGIYPNLVVLSFVSLMLLGTICFGWMAKKKKKPFLVIPTMVLFILGFAVSISWIQRDFKIRQYQLTDSQKQRLLLQSSEKEGYAYIGEVRGTNLSDRDDNRTFALFVKTIEGKKYYYCSRGWGDAEKHLVTKYNSQQGQIYIGEQSYKIEYDFDWNSAEAYNAGQNTSNATGRAGGETNSSSESEDNEIHVVVDHQRSPMPVNVWQPCGICGGTGNCNYCGGAGWVYSASAYDGRGDCPTCRDGKCSACGGERGRYVVEYR